MDSSKRVSVLVTAVGGSGVGEQILKALKLAGRPQTRIIAADVKPDCAQFLLADEAIVLPRADAPGYIDALLHVCRKLSIDMLFPGSEAELKVLSARREAIAAAGVALAICPHDVIETCMDKARTAAFLTENGFAPPATRRLASISDLAGIERFPVIVKPVSGGGSSDCFIAQTPRELALLSEYLLSAVPGRNLLLQEYVGTPEEEYTVGVLHDLDGRFLNSIAVRRDLSGQLNVRMRVPNRTGRMDLGPTLAISSGVSHGELGTFPEVTGPCERIAAALGVRGPINVQCRLVAGQIKVFEINPRFSGTTSLRAMVGYNEPGLLIRRHLLNEVITPRFSYRHETVRRTLVEQSVAGIEGKDWQRL